MNDSRQRGQNDERKEETPPYSRVFVVCSKQFTEEDLTGPFKKFGTIESMYMPRDRKTGDSKGIAYIKYTKTSAAAAAVQAMNMVCIKNTPKPLKVMVANQKNDDDSIAPESKYMRLFIMLSKNDTEAEIKSHFSTFGEIHSVYVQKNKGKFAYVSYKTFLDAAHAYEECDRKYKAVFATPKEELKRSRDSFESNMGSFNSSNSSLFQKDRLVPLDQMVPNSSRGCKRICVTVTPHLPERYIGNLFNIIPGMLNLQYSMDTYNGTSKAIITYDNDKSAALAVERVNNFEFPSGEIVSVKLDNNVIATAAKTLTNMVNTLRNAMDVGTSPNELVQLADAIAHASTLIKVASTGMTESLETSGYCSVRLPPTQDLVDGRSHVAKRCFIVCKPHPPPPHVLKDVFCRFGDLIDVMTYPNKIFGFAKYASARAADDAIGTLDGATVSGIKLKVLEADEKQVIEDNSDKKRMKMDIDSKTI